MTPAAKARLLRRVQSAAATLALLDARGEADDQAARDLRRARRAAVRAGWAECRVDDAVFAGLAVARANAKRPPTHEG